MGFGLLPRDSPASGVGGGFLGKLGDVALELSFGGGVTFSGNFSTGQVELHALAR